MKKVSTVILLLVTVISYSQNDLKKSDIETTDEEYRFLTEKYVGENNGLLQEGYQLESFVVLNSEKFNCDYKFFIESETKKVKAILITITKKRNNDDKVRYLCLPINNEVLFKKFVKNIEKLGLTLGTMFIDTGALMVSSYVEQQYNSNKKDIKTTEAEYEFLTETYDSVDNINLLNGYELKPLIEKIIEEKYKYNYQLFVESDSQNVKAVLITLTKLKKNDNKIKYLCMPLNNKELKTKFLNESINLGLSRVNMSFYLDMSYFSLISKIMDNRYNGE